MRIIVNKLIIVYACTSRANELTEVYTTINLLTFIIIRVAVDNNKRSGFYVLTLFLLIHDIRTHKHMHACMDGYIHALH